MALPPSLCSYSSTYLLVLSSPLPLHKSMQNKNPTQTKELSRLKTILAKNTNESEVFSVGSIP